MLILTIVVGGGYAILSHVKLNRYVEGVDYMDNQSPTMAPIITAPVAKEKNHWKTIGIIFYHSSYFADC